MELEKEFVLMKDMSLRLVEEQEKAKPTTSWTVNLTELIQTECYNALVKIKALLEDDCLEDPECFHKIEEIVSVFEGLGSNAGGRHDF